MTDNQIKGFINKLNKGNASDNIFLRSLSQSVDFGFAWHSLKNTYTKQITMFGPDKFYFIKNEAGMYVAAVNDGGNDLHWLVASKYRGKGYLSKALKETIVPHIFQNSEKIEQRITVSRNAIGDKNYAASTKLAKSLGFIEYGSDLAITEFIVSKNLFKGITVDSNEGVMSDERIKLLKYRANEIAKSLLKIESELEITLGHSNLLNEMKAISGSVMKAKDIIHDLQWYKNID
jgi:hypothetical protein